MGSDFSSSSAVVDSVEFINELTAQAFGGGFMLGFTLLVIVSGIALLITSISRAVGS